MSILFINGSPNKNGNTAALAAELLKGHEYETLNLTDYTIGAYGQNLPGDGLDAVIGAMKQAGIVYAAEQMVDLVANGVRGVHVYTMNKPDVAGAIVRELGSIIHE